MGRKTGEQGRSQPAGAVSASVMRLPKFPGTFVPLN